MNVSVHSFVFVTDGFVGGMSQRTLSVPVRLTVNSSPFVPRSSLTKSHSTGMFVAPPLAMTVNTR